VLQISVFAATLGVFATPQVG